MNCLIVDDEVLAQDVLEHYIQQTETLTLKGRCNNALEAFALLNKEQIDLMFLDIKMPEISGIDFIKSLRNIPRIIITTAYHEYALEGYELDIVDYLLKPVSFERFLKAVGKLSAPANLNTATPGAGKDKSGFFVKSDRKLVHVDPREIRYIEGLKNYLLIHTKDSGKLIVHSTMVNMEAQLQPYSYMLRVHKSFLVNRSHIKEIDGNIIRLTDNTQIPLGALYKESFLNTIQVL